MSNDIIQELLSSPFSLVEHYPGFQSRTREALRLIVGEDVEERVEIGMAKDGSGVGGE